MQFKFTFSVARDDKIPLLNVIVKNPDNDKTMGYTALLDSGAFISIFHTEVAGILGIDLSKNKSIKFTGVRDSDQNMEGKPYVVRLMVSQKGNSHSFDSLVVFSDEVSKDGYPILGRQGFFDQFSQVCFDYSKNKFYLNKA